MLGGKKTKSLTSKINGDISLIWIGFIDKYFSPGLYQKDYIICENTRYSFHNKDVYHDENDMYTNDIFIYEDNSKLKTTIKWFPEYNKFNDFFWLET